MQTQLTLVSSNAKTGPIPVSTTTAESCPTSCAFNHKNKGGCYAEYGPLAIHWRKVTQGLRGGTFNVFLQAIKAMKPGQLWRHNQAGDLPGVGDAIDRGLLTKLVRANKGRRGFTYTHKPVLGATSQHSVNRSSIQKANKGGFTVNLSANNLREADRLANLGIAPVVVVLPVNATHTETPEGRKVAVCPATYMDTNCAGCQLCQRQGRQVIVGFPAHGTARNKAAKVAA